MKELTKATYIENIKMGSALVVVGADWCPDCKKIKPILDNMEVEYGSRINFFHVNFSAEEDLKETLNIRRIPTLIFYKNGDEVGDRLVEPNSQALIEESLQKIL